MTGLSNYITFHQLNKLNRFIYFIIKPNLGGVQQVRIQNDSRIDKILTLMVQFHLTHGGIEDIKTCWYSSWEITGSLLPLTVTGNTQFI